MLKTLGVLVSVAVLVTVVVYTDRKLGPVKPVEPAAAAKPPAVAPEMAFQDLAGRTVDLRSLRGKVVWVDFWQTWCEPCKVEIPWLIDFQQKYSSQGFTVLGVALDEEGAKVVEPFLAKQRFKIDGQPQAINYPIVLGNDELAEKLVPDLVGYPTGVLLSRDGKIVKVTLGLVSYDEMDSAIQKQLQAPQPASSAPATR
jgi:thiol-disulfide isomerase/thioredoxin